MIPTSSIVPLLTRFVRWASSEARVVAVALVGSYARREARPDSDVDLVVLTNDPEHFREARWVHEIPWAELGIQVTRWEDRQYGIVWSRHIQLSSGLTVEVGLAPLEWAATDPYDKGTRRVIEDGCWIILDPSGLLNLLVGTIDRDR